MKKDKLFFKLNNKGASLVMVIIIIGFIGILAGTVMMTSLVNYKMKRVNVYAKDTFYSAEQVLDEINIGLQRYISDSMSSAYMDVMENYSEYSVSKKRSILQTHYYENMWDKLQADSNQSYDVSVLESFVKPTTLWHPDASGDLENGYGAIVRAVNAEGNLDVKGTMATYDNGIVLKDLKIYYKDSKGFVSVIQTDIRLTYPEMDFAQTTALPDIASYGVIADAGLVADGNTSLALEGNFYLDSFTSTCNNINSRKKINHTGDGRVVVKHEMLLKNSSFVNEETATVWAENIETVGSTLTLLGETLVADDLNVNGDGSVITLSGIYNGFGNSIKDSSKSSAILINGTNSSLDLTGLEKLTLAGHAYIGTMSEPDEEGKKVNGADVFTGESIAVKSNQLMYLIPAECIGVDSQTGESAYTKNPLTMEEYSTITQDPTRYTEVSLDVKVKKLNSTLREYIAKKNGVAEPEVVFEPISGLVYYYMKFTNEEMANKYFSLYYNANKETYDRYIESYVKALDFPTTATGTRIKMAAYGVYGNAEDGYSMLVSSTQGASMKFANNQVQYSEQFLALCTNLTENYAQLAGVVEDADMDRQILFDNLVNKDKLKAYIEGCGGSGAKFFKIDGEDFGKTEDVILSVQDSLTISDPNVNLVIATGDVTIDVKDFKGTVFSDGKVILSDKVESITADYDLVSAMLRYYKEFGGQNVMVAQVLQAADDYVFAIEDAEDTQRTTTTMADLIVYENWKKE